jgi:hypothetical protein
VRLRGAPPGGAHAPGAAARVLGGARAGQLAHAPQSPARRLVEGPRQAEGCAAQAQAVGQRGALPQRVVQPGQVAQGGRAAGAARRAGGALHVEDHGTSFAHPQVPRVQVAVGQPAGVQLGHGLADRPEQGAPRARLRVEGLRQGAALHQLHRHHGVAVGQRGQRPGLGHRHAGQVERAQGAPLAPCGGAAQQRLQTLPGGVGVAVHVELLHQQVGSAAGRHAQQAPPRVLAQGLAGDLASAPGLQSRQRLGVALRPAQAHRRLRARTVR